jgi:quercetin dioxygenase-like cupin family protein
MRIRADFTRPVTLDTTALPWQPSPDGSVLRRMLDRIGDEVARATSIVRYPPESRFPAHQHPLGEEFLVLDGVFSDEHADYAAGTYVRNPPGSGHSPHSDGGCTIFVKLRQMPPTESRFARVDASAGSWRAWRNLQRLDLFDADYETVFLAQTGPGEPVTLTLADTGLEALVLAGGIEIDGENHGPLAWLRRPPDRAPAITLAADTRVWIKTGHLAAADEGIQAR